MGILRANTISGLGTDGAVFQGVTKFDTQGYVVPSSGTTDQRSAGITTTQGAIRFNTDSQKLEFYAQDQWWEMVIDTPALGIAADTGKATMSFCFCCCCHNCCYYYCRSMEKIFGGLRLLATFDWGLFFRQLIIVLVDY
jgi:hypothetical protein